MAQFLKLRQKGDKKIIFVNMDLVVSFKGNGSGGTTLEYDGRYLNFYETPDEIMRNLGIMQENTGRIKINDDHHCERTYDKERKTDVKEIEIDDRGLEDKMINGKSYPPVITINQLLEIWRKQPTIIYGVIKALKIMNVNIGVLYGNYWSINRDIAVECMINGKLHRAIQAVKEGRVPKGRM